MADILCNNKHYTQDIHNKKVVVEKNGMPDNVLKKKVEPENVQIAEKMRPEQKLGVSN